MIYFQPMMSMHALTAWLLKLGSCLRHTFAPATLNLPQSSTIQRPKAGLLNKRTSLAPALGVTKFIIILDMILVTLCCVPEVWLRCPTSPPLRPVCQTVKSNLSRTTKCDQNTGLPIMNLVTIFVLLKSHFDAQQTGHWSVYTGNTKGGSITVPLTSYLTCLD